MWTDRGGSVVVAGGREIWQGGAEMWADACREMSRDVQRCAQMHEGRCADSCIDPGRCVQGDGADMCRKMGRWLQRDRQKGAAV